VSARAAVKKPAGSSELRNSTLVGDNEEEDARMESSALVADLKEKLEQFEMAEQEHKKQIEVLQARFDEAIREQGKLEERVHEEEERVEGLENDKREGLRQKRELETIYEAERVATMKEREATQVREEELQNIIQRLKESLSQKESRPGTDEGRLSRTGKCWRNTV
jgi:chromosome segregation ATPase